MTGTPVSELNVRSHRLTPVVAVLAALAAVLLALPLVATSAAASPKVDPALVGLYGSADPTYDGVFRQSLGILGILAAGDEPADDAVQWLVDQQCSDGGFMAFNPDPAAPCVAPDLTNFVGEDTNSAALAAQALFALGHTAQADAALSSVEDARNKDGGWPYIPGGDSDLNSTGLALMALNTAGVAVDQAAVDYVAGFQVDCSGAAQDRGGIASPYSGGAPDLLSTVQAVPGIAGLSLVDGPASHAPWADDLPAFSCPVDNSDTETVAGWGAAWLDSQVAADAVTGGNAGWAVLSFASTRTGHDAAQSLYTSIAAELGTTATQKGAQSTLAAQSNESPGALGLAALAGTTLGDDVSTFSARIAATMTQPAAPPKPTPSTSTSPAPSGDPGANGPTLPDTGGITGPLALSGVGLVLAGVSLIVVTRRRRTETPPA
jgi:LPXTG-motif cell wall-anchored protein